MGENMSIVSLPLPDWTADITIIIFVLAFGSILIKKVMKIIKDLLTSFHIEAAIVEHFMLYISTVFWLSIFGLALTYLPTLFSPNIFPASIIGSLLLRFVGYMITLTLPIVILFFLMEYKKQKEGKK